MIKNGKVYVFIVLSFIFMTNLKADPLKEAFDEANLFNKRKLEKIKPEIEKAYQKNPNLKNALKLMLVNHNYTMSIMQREISNLREGDEKKALQVRVDKKRMKLLNDSIKTIKKLYRKFKKPIFLAYLGSLETIKGGVNSNASLKALLVNKGLKKMDKAITLLEREKDPDRLIYLKMLRANNNIELPKFFNRTEVAYKDFKWIYERVYKKYPKQFTGNNRASFLFGYARVLALTGNKNKARKFYTECVKKHGKTIFGQRAKKRLK